MDEKMTGQKLECTAVATLLILLALAARLISHVPNLTPFTAIALFAGARIHDKRLALAVPLVALAISDWALGFYPAWYVVYGAFVLTTALGFVLREHRGFDRILGVSALSSLLFFVITNLGVWACTKMYAPTWLGLVQCFYAALPFFKNTFVSTLVFSMIFFGIHRIASKALAKAFA